VLQWSKRRSCLKVSPMETRKIEWWSDVASGIALNFDHVGNMACLSSVCHLSEQFAVHVSKCPWCQLGVSLQWPVLAHAPTFWACSKSTWKFTTTKIKRIRDFFGHTWSISVWKWAINVSKGLQVVTHTRSAALTVTSSDIHKWCLFFLAQDVHLCPNATLNWSVWVIAELLLAVLSLLSKFQQMCLLANSYLWCTLAISLNMLFLHSVTKKKNWHCVHVHVECSPKCPTMHVWPVTGGSLGCEPDDASKHWYLPASESRAHIMLSHRITNTYYHSWYPYQPSWNPLWTKLWSRPWKHNAEGLPGLLYFGLAYSQIIDNDKDPSYQEKHDNDDSCHVVVVLAGWRLYFGSSWQLQQLVDTRNYCNCNYFYERIVVNGSQRKEPTAT